MSLQTAEKENRVSSSIYTADSANDAESGSSGAVRWLVVLTAVLLTRFSWIPSWLSTDTVNLAYALESFDPLNHQPHPPGYPLFVGFARLIRLLTPNAEVTFWIISVLVTIASICVLYFLAERMISRWAALAAAILFLLNPVFWFSRLQSPLRPWLALFSLLVAYCSWRCWTGERRFALYGAAALGVGAGFRPDLLAYLMPLWAVSAWRGTRSWKTLIHGGLMIAGLSAVWLGVVVYAMGGIASAAETMTNYLLAHSRRNSLLLAESLRFWLRPLSRLVIWNALALVGWVWAPIIFRRRWRAPNVPWLFFMAWILPGMMGQVFFHIAAPGHTLFATPVWCLAGACLISGLGKRRNMILAVAAAVNAALFLNVIPRGYPSSPEASLLEKAWVSARNSVAYGTFETSMERLRWWEEMTEVSVQELGSLSARGRPTLIFALNGTDTDFDFASWRVVSYYMDEQELWVLNDNIPAGQPWRVRQVRGKDVLPVEQSTITLPHSCRILWVMRQGGRFHQALEKVIPVHRGRYILYSDISPGTRAFEIEGFQFIPEAD